MSPEPYEHDLLMEAEGLKTIAVVFQRFDEFIEDTLLEYGDCLDPNLVVCLEIVRYDLNLTLSGVVKFEHVKVPGILKQLEDVLDEVQTLQAGKPTKEGIPDEGVDDP